MKAILSIICPVYNEEKHIGECIESVLRQSLKDIELILINDGSTDDSGKICDEYASRDFRVKVIHQENQGVSVAREKGYLASQGDYIAFIDADDYIDPKMYEKLLDKLIKHGADISICKYFDLELVKIFKQTPLETIASIYSGKERLNIQKRAIKEQDFDLVLWNKVYKRELFERVDYLRFKAIIPQFYFEDFILTLILLHHSKKVVKTSEKLYFYRSVENSLSRQGLNIFDVNRNNAQKILLDLLKEYGYEGIYAEQLKTYGNQLIKIWMQTKDNNALLEFNRIFMILMKKAKCSLVYKISFVIFRASPRLWLKIAEIYPSTHIDGKSFKG